MLEVKAGIEKIHPMDNGTLWLSASSEGHDLEYHQVWQSCGEIQMVVECSCGFSTVEAPGRGCWQWGHNVPHTACLDDLHADLLILALDQASRQGLWDIGAPVEWLWLAELIHRDYSKRFKDKKLGFRAWKEAQMLVEALGG